jgi:glycosyltransferase involved in cell wall biosynthesis
VSPRVSIVLPYRDVGGFVEEALGGVLAQQGVSLEVLAIDDGSADDGPARVARMAARDARIVPLATGGIGLVGALELGRRSARGPLLARMDGDDVALPGRLARQVALLEAQPSLGAVGTRVEAFADGPLGEGMQRYVEWQNGLVTAEDHARQLFVESPLCHPSVMLRREALDAVGGYRDGPWPEDYDLWLRLDAHGFGLAKVPEVLLRWRHRPGRATFRDPRYALHAFFEAKGRFLAPRLSRLGRPIAVWGAGPTGKRTARALEASGVFAELFVDIDPRKIGRVARGVPIASPSALERGRHTVVVAVGARGARDLVRAELAAGGFVEGEDYVCAA